MLLHNSNLEAVRLSQKSFIFGINFFISFFNLVTLQLINFTLVNDDKKQNEEARVCIVLLHIIR